MEDDGDLCTIRLKDQSCIAREVNRLTTGQIKACYPEEEEEEAEVSFKAAIFVKNLVVHLFHPVPYILWDEGMLGLYNRELVGCAPLPFLQWLLWASFWASIALFLNYRPPGISYAEMALFVINVIIRHAIVATKHAYLSHAELHRMSQVKIQKKEFQKRQILTGWTILSNEMIEQQLHLASVRKKVDLRRFVFEVPERDSQEFAESALYNEKFNAWSVARELIHAANAANHFPFSLYTGYLLGFLHAVIPLIVRASTGEPISGGSSNTDIPALVITVLMILVNTFMIYSNFSFLAVAIIDYRRRRFVSESLGMFLTHSVVRTRSFLFSNGVIKARQLGKDGQENAFNNLQINLGHPQNVVGWYMVRMVLQNFGEVFYRRVNVYAAYFGVYVIAMVAFLILQALVPAFAMNMGPLMIILFDLFTFMVLMMLIASQGGSANQINRLHAFHLANKRLDSLSLLTSPLEEDVAQLVRTASTLLDTVISSVRAENLHNSIKILGFEAGQQLAATFLTLASTGIAAGVRSFQSL